MAESTVCQSKWKLIVEPRRAKPKTYRQAPTHWLKVYEEAVTESEARTADVQLKSIAINNDWVDSACSLPHNIQAIANSFITANKFSELLRKVRFTYNFSKSVH